MTGFGGTAAPPVAGAARLGADGVPVGEVGEGVVDVGVAPVAEVDAVVVEAARLSFAPMRAAEFCLASAGLVGGAVPLLAAAGFEVSDVGEAGVVGDGGRWGSEGVATAFVGVVAAFTFVVDAAFGGTL